MGPDFDDATDRQGVLFLAQVINCNDGITTYCQTLAEGLKARGVPVYLVSGSVRSDEKSERKREMLQQSLREWRTINGIRRFPSISVIREIASFIRSRKIAAINAHGLGMLYLGRVLSLMTGAKLIATYHPSVIGNLHTVVKSATSKWPLGQRMFLNLFFPDKLIVLSEESVQFMRLNGIWFENRMVKLYGGTDLSQFHPPSPEQREEARRAYALDPDDIVIILAGRLAWVKGHDLLVKAVRQLRDQHPEISLKCLFVGSGGKDREAEIISFAHSGGEADERAFRFLGFMSDVRQPLWASDIFVLPSRFEGFPLGVAEAMSTGLPAIRTPSGGATDQVIDGRTGYIVPFEDVDALADAIRRLADPEVRREMSRQSMDRAQRYFGVKPMVDALLPMYGLAADQAM